MKKTILNLFFIAGILLILDALVITFITGPNIANFLTFASGAAFVLLAYVIHEKVKNKFMRFAAFCGALYLCYALCMSAFIVYSARPNTSYTEDSVIILGAGIKGDKVLPTLKKRLDAGVKYLQKNENAIVIVSGGQGHGESISEALAMKNYLLSKGVKEERILMENQSRDTRQNLAFSKEILDTHFAEKSDYTTLCITTRSHLYRAQQLGKEINWNMTGLASDVPFYLAPPVYLRETLALPYAWLKTYL
ncbi:uncharacterized SAM-binding protein YcdF (DUF218 family) [Elusimicrobium posterum]|uniref:YdcF family protein n=1 Tax=Elusimicrobium posterum TaxID=3116653 RepID=UPI003C76A564